MKTHSIYKNMALIVAFILVSLACVISLLSRQTVAEVASGSEAYFYSQLDNDLSKKFYKAIEDMEKEGYLAKGNYEYNLLDGTLKESDLSKYANGGDDLLRAFGSARDAYVLDNADNFYIDFSRLSISVGKQNGKFVATLGTGRTDTYYIENGLNSESEIASAKTALNAKVSELVAGSENLSDSEKVVFANNKVVEACEYSFCNDASKLAYEPFIRTAYGALVNGYAVCEGYARALKVLLDEMGIQNVLVYGYLLSNDNTFEAHMWNYVNVGNKWFAVDATINDTMRTSDYVLMGADKFDVEHLADGVISESNFEFSYPVLSRYNFGGELLPTVVEYADSILSVSVSYNNKNATDLAKDGLYLVQCYSTQTSEENNIVWTQWIALSVAIQTQPEVFEETDDSFIFKDWGSTPFIKFAVIKKAPDNATFGTYNAETLLPSDILCESDIITNEAYDGVVASPFANVVSPSNVSRLDILKSYDISLKYDEQLVKTDGQAVAVDVVTSRGVTAEEYKLSNVVWNEAENTLSFTFTPSRMYAHNGEGYGFVPTNLVGQDSGKAPHAVYYSFQYKSIVCNKILDDGRLYLDIYGNPRLIDNSDLSMSDWTVDGVSVGQNQRSQFALVITEPSEKTSQDMIDSAMESENLTKADALASSTYEIDLALCGKLAQIPSGAYLKLSLGFPAGYSAEDEGVTFKIYHFEYDAGGNIDSSKTRELPCVITKYGLVVEVNDFSPFAVVAVAKDKVTATGKSVYARTIGYGGSVVAKIDNVATSAIAVVNSNQTLTYTLVPSEGYKVDYAIMNNKEVKVDNNSITLNYADLAYNNLLEVAYVAESVEQREQEQGIVNLQKEFSLNYGEESAKNNAFLIAIVVVASIIVVALVVCCVLYAIKRRQNNK